MQPKVEFNAVEFYSLRIPFILHVSGLDIPRIASFLSANGTAYRKREEICYHLGIPHEDLQFIRSLPPFQFFSKLLWSWELRDDAWAEIRLARALNHIGITEDNKIKTPDPCKS